MMAQPAVQQDMNARSTPRSHLFLSATIHFDNISAAIRLRDLSVSGARIDGATLPATGATVTIRRGDLHAKGMIVWHSQKSCGLRFDSPLALHKWMPEQASRDRTAVDDMIEVLPFQATPPASKALRDVLSKRLAEELAYVGRLLESLGDDLSAEPLIVMRHAEKLQNLDISTQILGHVAALLVSADPERSIDSITMSSLRKRLQRISI
jgi:hypothetical protein